MLTNAFLSVVGLDDLPAATKPQYLDVFRSELELAVGHQLAEQLTPEQRRVFSDFAELDDEAAARAWLAQQVPDFRDVVRAELDRLRDRVRSDAPAILALETLYAGATADAAEAVADEPGPGQLAQVFALLGEVFPGRVTTSDATVVVDLPDSMTPIVAYASSDDTVTFQSGVHPYGAFDDPRLGVALADLNAGLLFGRLHRLGEREIAVDYSVFVDGASAPQLRDVVLALRAVALRTAGDLHDRGLVRAA
ncbi:MAG: DUF5663 domain-containing protein [Solirubrobacteraceae bacterium]|nr:DUF5663 domain-containing protein [Patulibacter sp.]